MWSWGFPSGVSEHRAIITSACVCVCVPSLPDVCISGFKICGQQVEAAAARTDDVMDYTQMKIKAQQMFTDVSSTVCVLLYQTHVTRAAAVKEASAL